jgi:hypothetical protein
MNVEQSGPSKGGPLIPKNKILPSTTCNLVSPAPSKCEKKKEIESLVIPTNLNDFILLVKSVFEVAPPKRGRGFFYSQKCNEQHPSLASCSLHF